MLPFKINKTIDVLRKNFCFTATIKTPVYEPEGLQSEPYESCKSFKNALKSVLPRTRVFRTKLGFNFKFTKKIQ